MLWLRILTLLVSGQNLVLALPLRNPDLHAQAYAGPLRADQDIAEVLLYNLDMIPVRATEKGLCPIELFFLM